MQTPGDYKTMEITTRIGCRVMCSVCPQELLVRRFREEGETAQLMSLETFKTCVDKIPPEIFIAFSGMAEPFLNPDCSDMIRYAADAGHRLSLYTTCLGMTCADVEKISSLEFRRFVLHLPDRDSNARIPVTKQYLEVLSAILQHTSLTPHLSAMGPLHEQIVPLLEGRVVSNQMEELYSRGGSVDCGHKRHATGAIYCSRCPSLQQNVLLPNGDVLLCCMDYGLEHRLGNLLRDSYSDLHRSPAMDRLRRAQQDPAAGDVLCRRCEAAVEIEDTAQIEATLAALSRLRLELGQEVTLLDAAWRELEPGRLRLYLLYSIRHALPGDFRIFLHARPPEGQHEILPPSRRQHGFDNWDFNPPQPTSAWEQTEHLLIHTDIIAEAADYTLSTGFCDMHGEVYGRSGWFLLGPHAI